MVVIGLQIKFRSRTSGSFGRSPVGRTMEWITQTWLRFTCALISAITIVIVFSADAPAENKISMIVLSPLLAIFWWYLFLLLILLCRYLGAFGKVLANVLVVYFFLF